jgi:glyoxylase-like metal-dependent hydrolase (beta-lactamase superfamily II)
LIAAFDYNELMNIQNLILGPLNTNCYLVVDNISQECLIIDPADSAETISSEVLRQNLQPVGMIATHGHYDHIMAAYELQLSFDLALSIHQKDEFLVDEMVERAAHWGHRIPGLQAPKKKEFIDEGDEIACGQLSFSVIHTPGHTPGGLCFYSSDERVIFTGDTLFADGVGRTDLSYSSDSQLRKSLDRIRNKFEGYQAYAGHG